MRGERLSWDPHHLPALGDCLHGEPLDQRALADDVLPAHHHGMLSGPGQQTPQRCQLGVPAHQSADRGHGLSMRARPEVQET